jgi:hypothetical protein
MVILRIIATTKAFTEITCEALAFSSNPKVLKKKPIPGGGLTGPIAARQIAANHWARRDS